MPIIIIFLVAGAIYFLQEIVYSRFWNVNLHAEVHFSQKNVHEGEKTFLLEEVSNGKILPMPWVYVKFQINRNGNVEQHRSDLFSIRFYQKIRRKIPIDTSKRGFYSIRGVDLISNNLFITSKFVRTLSENASMYVYPRLIDIDEFRIPYQTVMGEIVTRRFMIEDPFLFKGIREYQPYDSFKSINFKASAKAGEWLVNVNEYTVSQKLTLLLNMDRANQYYDPRLYENSIRLTASFANQFEQEGIPVQITSNGIDVLSGSEVSVEAGCGNGHMESVFESLAKLEIALEVQDFSPVIENAALDPNQDAMYVLISPFFGEKVVEAFRNLKAAHPEAVWILPVSASDLVSENSIVLDLEKKVSGLILWNAEKIQ